MTKNLDEFYECIDLINKDISTYTDKDFNYSVLPTAGLLVAVDYNELNKQQWEIAKFNQDIPKDFEAEIEKIDRTVNKYDLTHKEKDKFTLTTKKEAIRKVWFVMNQFKVKKAFKDGKEALDYAKKINNPILEVLNESSNQ
jgi:hypothetical protein